MECDEFSAEVYRDLLPILTHVDLILYELKLVTRTRLIA